ncbi:ABC transporter substrate-binding protein [Haloactinomyces albus]|uniref:Peptide/nickel transport system substrate-binding protein n=1 Tax=Haloactinomyces albus TaxID=1352928 RepID=A0AAE3ZJ35_9ACTN|nr:ABC transporter substrate-binding protein [Haloactinomyces albus]MDR7303839.1 peptide/nickel transport system substrate-binding protein [Haloactinomyces albus]
MRLPRSGRWRAALALAASAMVVSACATPGAEPEQDAGQDPQYQVGIIGADQQQGQPVDGGTLTIAAYSEARSLDPAKTIPTGSSGGTALAAVYDVLMRYDPESGTYEPWLAESLESNADDTTWTLTLREGVRFSDGTPLDAKAVVGSIQRYMQKNGFGTKLLDASLERMRTPDPRTVLFELTRPWAKFPNVLGAGAGMIVAPAAYAGEQFTPIGAGPFQLERYAPGEELVLAARAGYWQDTVHLDRLRFVWYQGPDAKLGALRSGSVDMAYLRDPKAVDDARAEGYGGYMAVNSLGNQITINNREGTPGADPRVRKAIALALRPELNYRRAYDGAGLPGKDIFQPASRWHVSGVTPPPTDTARARKLLEQAKADGYDGTISYLDSNDPASRAEALAAKAALEKVGFTVRLDFARSIAEQIKRIYVDHDYELAKNATSVPEADPLSRLYSFLHSESNTNPSGYANPRMDELLVQLQAADSVEKRKAVLADIERLWWQDVPSVPLGAAAQFMAWQDTVRGVVPTQYAMLLFGKAWVGK